MRGRGWHGIGQTIVNAAGEFALTHVFWVPGASEIRVLVRSNKRNALSPSNTLSYDISQAQNPALTILTSADPIAYGGSVVISGVAAGAPNAALTLLARTAGGSFKPVATTTADGEGKYAFPAQTTRASSFYRVQGANRRSAVLYQGVKYVLTAVPGGGQRPVRPAVLGHGHGDARPGGPRNLPAAAEPAGDVLARGRGGHGGR